MKKSKAFIRDVSIYDYRALISFFRENDIPEITRYFHPFPFSSEMVEKIIKQIEKDKYYISLMGKTIVGFSMLRGWDEGFTIPSFGIMVDHRYQGRGIGRLMLEFSLEEAAKLNCEKIRLNVYASNYKAIRLYETYGFREIMRKNVNIDDDYDEKITMVKDLIL